ncbi:MAG: hypothetical protein JHD04_08405, partial [Nocardioides sp.]|nr:hypothetical protein [Nocardioides sp.]
MRLPPLPGPSDVRWLVDQAVAAGPRVVGLLAGAEALLASAQGLVGEARLLLERVDATRLAADEVVAEVDRTRARADRALTSFEPLAERVAGLLDD